MSPRECLGFRLLQFISFKNKWRGKEPLFEFVEKPAPLFSTFSAPVGSNFTRFQRKRRLPSLTLKQIFLLSGLHLSQTYILSLILTSQARSREFYIIYVTYIAVCEQEKNHLVWAKNQREKFEIFQSNKSTNSCLVPNIVLPWFFHTVVAGSGGNSCREMG